MCVRNGAGRLDSRSAVAVHGWIYDVQDGLLRDLEVSTFGR